MARRRATRRDAVVKRAISTQQEMLEALHGNITGSVHMAGGRITMPAVEGVRDILSQPGSELLVELFDMLHAMESDQRVPVTHRIAIGGMYGRIAMAHARRCAPMLDITP